MKKLITIKNSDFLFSAPDAAYLAQQEIGNHDLSEVAFIGRSNAGKSTLINKLTQRKSLAHVSKTPGKTRLFNFFKVGLGRDGENKEIIITDLPGYGYAKRSKSERFKFAKSVEHYVLERKPLALMCLLLDCRRNPEEEELYLRDIAYKGGVGVLVIATKVDKLNQKERHARLKEFAESFQLDLGDFVTSGSKTAPEQIWHRILAML